jgi:hypothetical protein
MAKLDKETMKKQHFWLLLIPLFIGLLLAWIGLFFGVADATKAQADENEKQKKTVESAKAQPKKMLELYDAQKGELYDLRTLRWQEMWDLQQEVYKWPTSIGEEQILKVKDLPFGAEIADSSFLTSFREHYAKEFDTVAKDAEPIQFAGGWINVLRHVPAWKRTPESEDVWLAAEDFWVQREIIRALSEVNRDAAKFHRLIDLPPGHARKPATDDPRHRVFYNRTWELDLEITDEKGGTAVRGKVRNLTDRLQPYNVNNELLFKVWLSENSKPFMLAIEGASQEGGRQEPIKFVPKKHLVFEGAVQELYKVEQVFDVRTAPVKRVDQLRLGYLSARHSDAELQMAPFSTKAAEEEGKVGGGAGGMGPGGPMALGGPGGGPGGPPPGPGLPGAPGGYGMGGAAAANTNATFNGLARQRYIHRTDQVRAMPIGMAIIADQAFVQDILTALANSKLRFQTVQTHIARFRGSLSYVPAGAMGGFGGFRPPGGGDDEEGPRGLGPPPGPTGGTGGPGGPPPPGRIAGPPPPGRIGGPPVGVPPVGVPPMGPPGFPGIPGFPGFPGGGGFLGGIRSSAEDQVAGNLVEVGIYGLTSLYEKFQKPEAKKDDAVGGAPPVGAPIPPAGPGTPMPPAGPGGPMPPAEKGNVPMPPAEKGDVPMPPADKGNVPEPPKK